MAPNLNCPECDARADLTKDGEWAHCASCNNIFQPNNIKSSDKGADKADGNGEEKKEEKKAEERGEGDQGREVQS